MRKSEMDSFLKKDGEENREKSGHESQADLFRISAIRVTNFSG